MNITKQALSKEQRQARKILWHKGVLRWKLHPLQTKIYDSYYGNNDYITTLLISRQTGKCIKAGTLVATPLGAVSIENIKVGDIIYGYNKDGSISPTEVKQIHNQGIKKIVDLKHRGRVIASATLDHRWLAYNTITNKNEVVTTEELIRSSHKKIKREYFNYVGGDIHEPHAYSIGALIGDGYCKFNKNTAYQTSISSEDNKIPEAVALEIGCYFWKQGIHNYNWILSSSQKGRAYADYKNKHPLIINHYNEWCKDRLAHQKICDYATIRNWTRESQLRFLAGLIDTDGSIYTVGQNRNELKFSISMQSKNVIDVIEKLFLDLWQIELCKQIDNRPKYVNGPCYTVYSNNNFIVKHFLKELSPYIVTDRKQYKPEYNSYPEYNHISDYVGVVAGDEYDAQTYDLGIDNDTHLYCLANGLVTHNSFLLCILAIETCLKNPNSIVKYACPKQKMVKTILKPIMRQILEDCPKEIRPEYKENDKLYVFPNGSEIQMAGTDNQNYDNIRGGKSSLWIVDEAGFCSDLDKVVFSVLSPTTLTTDGRGVLASTPDPDAPEHPFIKEFVEPAKSKGKLFQYTLFDNPLLDEAKRQSIIDQYPGGIKNPKFKAEYLCVIERNTENTVVPEFDDETEKIIVTDQYKRPTFYDTYESMDIGGKDFTVILFAFYDFQRNKVVIEDECVIKEKQNSEKIKKGIQDTENTLWGEKPVYLRFADNNNIILLNDLGMLGLNFIPTRKDNKEAAINDVRIKIMNHDIIIHPRCKTLIYHLKFATWTKKTDRSRQASGYKLFARSADGGHFDALDSLIYLIRNVIYGKNPYPKGYNAVNESDNYLRAPEKATHQIMSNIFKVQRSIKKTGKN